MTRGPVAAVLLLRADGAALLQHRDERPEIPHAGKWTPPGGHCEPGESIEACARREFAEETGYRLGVLCRLIEFLDAHAEGFQPLRLTVFGSRYDGVQALDCREGQAVQFIPREEAHRYPIPGYLVDLWDCAVNAAILQGELAATRQQA